MTALLLLVLTAALPPLNERLDAAARQEFAGQYEQALAAVRTACASREKSAPPEGLVDIAHLVKMVQFRGRTQGRRGLLNKGGGAPLALDRPASALRGR